MLFRSAQADAKEADAEIYRAKIEYLDARLNEIQTIARKQDEELEKLNTSVNSARADIGRARGVRSVTATADELCAKLAELGHPCG